MDNTTSTVQAQKELFVSLLSGVKRDGIDKLLAWLEQSDFYTAPASTRFHLSCEGGLTTHSLNVYREAMKLMAVYYSEDEITDELRQSVTLCALTHDLCKANTYKVERRNRKNELGKWESYDAYKFAPDVPWGHSQKSVIMLQNFVKLSSDEINAILAHMGFSDAAFKGGDSYVGDIFDKSKLAVIIHCADMIASHIDEV